MSTYFSDYPSHNPEAIDAFVALTEHNMAQRDNEPTPREWRLNLLTVGAIIGGVLVIVGAVCLGLLFGAKPESEGLTDAQMWTQNTDLMSRSAFAVIALFLGAQTLLFVGAGHFATRMYLTLLRDLTWPGGYATSRPSRPRPQSDGSQPTRLPNPEIMNSARRMARALFRSEQRRAGAGDTTGDTGGHENG